MKDSREDVEDVEELPHEATGVISASQISTGSSRKVHIWEYTIARRSPTVSDPAARAMLVTPQLRPLGWDRSRSPLRATVTAVALPGGHD